MFVWFYTAILCLSAWMVSFFGTMILCRSAHILLGASDPNERDNHSSPTPTGGGVPMIVAIISFLTVTGIDGGVIVALILLMGVSLLDDLSAGISVKLRLSVHLFAAWLITNHLGLHLLEGTIPYAAEQVLWVIGLVWFMNLYNFMDGIDEITSVHTIMLGAGVAALAITTEASDVLTYDSSIMIAAVVGFWYFNTHPARMFMGDAGSIPLGALCGWFVLNLIAEGLVAAALILPAYYLVDATLTLLHRVLRGQKPWQAHSEHGYQRYVRSGKTHKQAVEWIARIMGVFLVLSLLTVQFPEMAWAYVAGAYGLSGVLYLYFVTRKAAPIEQAEDGSPLVIHDPEYSDVTRDKAAALLERPSLETMTSSHAPS